MFTEPTRGMNANLSERLKKALTPAPQPEIKMFATGLGLGVLLDATVIRALLPTFVAVISRWNWWLPG
ncbi:MMPL family transporter [Nonomuraea sp. CA-143628]|uniref:MMPL family transporter n=1 Tax=Nonomuraea sp. CA-143628 TaxID=3239997 RepID=UPI003D916FD6